MHGFRSHFGLVTLPLHSLQSTCLQSSTHIHHPPSRNTLLLTLFSVSLSFDTNSSFFSPEDLKLGNECVNI
ncbi:hypothetical protein B0T17DRAFT_97758 [Bombardia bombarda]|uniref:Uncharacterized protein n=1 Tax=Bombardia bombarda TaxID=252184 RepID=A0AA39XN37_9PEZI|nr:hypothetical protein B0T17DRAFT_97758 [Bombardia bombarda]